MREHRQNGWVELSLDGRQVAGAVAGALVALSVVFAIGVGFGRQLATSPSTPQAADLARLDAPPPTPRAAPAPDTAFLFHEELRKSEPLQAPPTLPAAKPVVAEPAPVAPAAQPIAPEPVPAAFASLPPVAAPVLVAAAEPAKAEPVKAEPKVEKKPEPAPAPVVEAAAEPAKKPTDPGQWTVQFGSSERRADADRLAAMLLDYGYAPFVAVADLPGKGRYYRVRVGRFATKEPADKLRADALTKHKMAGVVMPAK